MLWVDQPCFLEFAECQRVLCKRQPFQHCDSFTSIVLVYAVQHALICAIQSHGK
jgi:hypothetical protein